MSPLHAFGLVITHGEQTGERWKFRCELCAIAGEPRTEQKQVVRDAIAHISGQPHQLAMRRLEPLPPWRERAAWIQLLHRCRETDEWQVRPKSGREWGEL